MALPNFLSRLDYQSGVVTQHRAREDLKARVVPGKGPAFRPLEKLSRSMEQTISKSCLCD